MKKNFLLCLLLFSINCAQSQVAPKPYGQIPNMAQLNWHEMEMYCIIHFGVDTYTDKEWGFGDEDPAIINPDHFDAMQIVGAAKAGGFKGVVVVAKHHDGLCIWPTKTTEHNITKSPWKNGKGDMVKEYQIACNKLGMQLGLYCSPWDRNNALYGTDEYVQIYRAQLKELYTNYGPIFISWHDGANGGDGYYGGKGGERKIDRTKYYGWNTTWAMIRKLQPSAAIFGDIGPDVRWVGNEEGMAGTTHWATYSPQAPVEGQTPSNGYSKYWESTEGTHHGKYWMPAECDVPLRPGWFYHHSQNDQVKLPDDLLTLYYQSVGRGANLDLGLSPNKSGRLDNIDVKSLEKFGDILKRTFSLNLARGAKLQASNVRGSNLLKFGPHFLTDNDRYTYWATDDGVTKAQLVVDLGSNRVFNVIRLRENIKLGQRITSFAVDALKEGKWQQIASATTIGANRLIRLDQNIEASKVRLRIISADASIVLSDFGLFKEPEHLSAPVITRNKEGFVSIHTESPVTSIHFTTDGTNPTIKSAVYKDKFLFKTGGIIKSCSYDALKKSSELGIGKFDLSKIDWKVITKQPGTENNSINAIDEDPSTIWDSPQSNSTSNIDDLGEISIDMGTVQDIIAFTYLPRQDKKKDGIVDRYTFYSSDDGLSWKKITSGEFSNISSNPIEQLIQLKDVLRTRYFRFSALNVIAGNSITASEIGVQVKNTK